MAKLYAFWTTVNYREAYGMYTVNGILFNHESPLRAHNFVTRKITLGVTRVLKGESPKLFLGNLDAKRDWGYAEDYVAAMWQMLQLDEPHDLVIATGESHTVREFCTRAFEWAGVELRWEGKGVDEKGIDAKSGRTLIEIDPYYFRPTEVDYLLGNPAKAKKVLGWEPKVKFEQLVDIMMKADFEGDR